MLSPAPTLGAGPCRDAPRANLLGRWRRPRVGRLRAGPGPWTLAALWLALAAALARAPLEALLGLAALVLMAWQPALVLVLAAWSVPFGDRLAVATAAGGPSLGPALPLLALAAIAMGLRALAGGRLPGLGPARPLLLALGSWLLFLLAAPLWAPSLGAPVKELARWGSLALALWLAGGLGDPAGLKGRTGRRIALVLALVLAGGAVEAALGIRGALLREGPEAFATLGGRIHRAHGHFGQPNPFGAYMNQLWPLALAPFLVGLLGLGGGWAGLPRRRLLTAVGALAGVLSGAGLLLSWSRGAWLAALAGAGAMALLALAGGLAGRGPGRGRAIRLLWLGLVLGIGGLWAGGLERLPRAVLDRLSSSAQGGGLVIDVRDAEVTDANFAKVERLAHWQAALSMWQAAPWLGLGPGQYPLAYAEHRLPRWRDPLGHAHNLYLNLLAESGLVGLALLALFVVAAWRQCLAACLRPRSALEATFGLGLAGVLAALMVHSLLDHLLVHDLALQLGLSLGLLMAARGAAPMAATEEGRR